MTCPRLLLVALAVLLVVSPAVTAPTFFSTPDEDAFEALYPSRVAPDFVNTIDKPLTTISATGVTITQASPSYPSLLDSDVGFVWQTDESNRALGTLRLAFDQPVIAASGQYNWIPFSGGELTGDQGVIVLSANSQSGLVQSLTSADLPFKSGWFGVADPQAPFTSLDVLFLGMSGDLSLYFYDGPTSGAIEFVPAPALSGDYDGDGDVDLTDHSFWRRAYGNTVTPGASADGNGDGLVDAADYTVWRDHYTATTGATAVPEPAAASLVVLLSVACACVRQSPGRRV